MHPILHAFMHPGGLERCRHHKGAVENQKPGKLKASIVSTLLSDACKALTSAKQTPRRLSKSRSLGNLATMHSSMIRNPLGSSLGPLEKVCGEGECCQFGVGEPCLCCMCGLGSPAFFKNSQRTPCLIKVQQNG